MLDRIEFEDNEANTSAAKSRFQQEELHKKAQKAATQKHFAEVWN